MSFTADDYRAAAANTRNNPKMQAMLTQAAETQAGVERYHDTLQDNLRASWSVGDLLEEYELTLKLERTVTTCRHHMPLEHNCNACSDEDAAGGRPNPRREYDRRKETT